MALKLTPDTTVVETFTRGIIRDSPPNVLPPGAVYDATNFLFDRPGMAYKRGGVRAHSAAMGSCTFVQTVGIIEPPGRIVAVGSDETLYDVTSENSPGATSVGSVGFTTTENPPFFNGLLILTDDDAQYSGLGVAPKKAYFSSPNVALASLGGSPPTAWRSCVHINRILLARNFTYPMRIWFSPTPSPESTWDTAASYVDTTYEITGMASFQGVLFVFSDHNIERILGDIPPGTDVTDDNLTLQPHAGIGCADARSIVTHDSGVIFANPSGIYVVNSGGVYSITENEKGTGISSYWQSLFGDTDSNIACGLLGSDYLVVSVWTVVATVPTLTATLLCYLPTRAWTRMTGVFGLSYAAGNNPSNVAFSELYCGLGTHGKTVRLSSILTPSSTYKNDSHTSTAVTPTLQTRAFGPGPALKAWGQGGITYDMRDSASDNPTMAVQYKRGIEASTTRTVPESPLAETTAAVRKNLTFNTDSQNLEVTLSQSNASSKTEVYFFEVDMRPYSMGSEGTGA